MCDLPPAPSWRPRRMNPVSDASAPPLILECHCDAAVAPPLTHPPTFGALRGSSSRGYAYTQCKVFITFRLRSSSQLAFTAPPAPCWSQRPILGPREEN